MEDVLKVYSRPRDEKRPLVCLDEMCKQFIADVRDPQPALNKTQREAVQSAETYYMNHLSSMDYVGWQKRGQPIGCGVTEAACKTLIKQRMCQSGMSWSIAASDALISLPALYLTPSRWDHFWHRYSAPDPTALQPSSL